MTRSDASMARPHKQSYRKEKPICSHCGVLGHTVEKCYRLHGFPPGFKFTKNIKKPFVHSANHVQDTSGDSFISTQQNEVSQVAPQLTITPDQCQQLLSLLQHQFVVFHTSSSTNMAGSIHASSSAPSAFTSS
jgi:hypothetical protein